MYSDEIEQELANCDSFCGVYMSDTIPSSINQVSGGGMIINLDSSSQSGSHWIAFWINSESQSGEYFDSFGAPPPPDIQTRLCLLAPSSIIYSKACLQHESSSSCGLYCIFFIRHKCLGHSLPSILSHFSRSRGVNEIIVATFDQNCL